MSHQDQPQVGAVGFEIFVETKLDLATATDIKLRCRKPNGAVVEFTATAHEKAGPRENVIYGARYITTAAADLDQAGEWEVQVTVTMPTFTGAGKVAKMQVGEAL